jgi:hypothetical protein
MKLQIAPFLKVMLLIHLIFITVTATSQNTDHIIFEATSPSVTLRKYGPNGKIENNKAYYSPKHERLLFSKTDFEMYPDSEYYLVTARFKMLRVKGFADDPKREETHIKMEYYYLKPNPATSKVEEFLIWRHLGASYYPSSLKPIKDFIQKDQGDLRFIIDDKRQWLMQNNGKSDDAIFYIDLDKSLPTLSYVLVYSDLKWIIVNGIKVKG